MIESTARGRAGRRRPVAQSWHLCALCAALIIAVPMSAPAQDNAAQQAELARQEIERATAFATQRAGDLAERAADLGDDIAALQARSVEAAMAALSAQDRIRVIGDQIARLRAQAADQRAALEDQRARLSDLAGGLQRMARLPVTALAAVPELTDDVIRGAIVLNGAIVPLEREAAILRQQIEALAATRADLAEQREAAEAEQAALNARLAELETLTVERQSMLDVTLIERAELAHRTGVLAEQAGTLDGLLAALEEDEEASGLAARIAALRASVTPVTRISPPNPRPGDATRETPTVAEVNGVILPASGRIAVPFGVSDRYGETSQGITLTVEPGRPVVAPWDGTIDFSGDFGDFGRVLILNHGNGYHSVIAGIGRSDVTAGQPVLAGEPLAVTLPQRSGSAPPTLYFEVRHQGQAVNPLIGLAEADTADGSDPPR